MNIRGIEKNTGCSKLNVYLIKLSRVRVFYSGFHNMQRSSDNFNSSRLVEAVIVNKQFSVDFSDSLTSKNNITVFVSTSKRALKFALCQQGQPLRRLLQCLFVLWFETKVKKAFYTLKSNSFYFICTQRRMGQNTKKCRCPQIESLRSLFKFHNIFTIH